MNEDTKRLVTFFIVAGLVAITGIVAVTYHEAHLSPMEQCGESCGDFKMRNWSLSAGCECTNK